MKITWLQNHLKKQIPKKTPKSCFKICVPNLKSSRKGTNVTFLKLFLNTMIKNIKIHNILDITKISKSMELNKCSHWKKY